MADYVSELPDDIVCHIFSFLPLRDAVRAGLSLSRWKCLPDFRSNLHFDATNVLGKNVCSRGESEYHSKFLKAVDQFLDMWRGRKISTLSLEFGLRTEHALHINRWMELAIRMEVEKLDLDLYHDKHDMDMYIFPSQLMLCLNGSYLKHLCLTYCTLSLPFGCTSWLSRLTTLELNRVPLDKSSLDCILSGDLNLRSLKLSRCGLPQTLCVHIFGLNLKKLVIEDSLWGGIKLNCPNLEIFEYIGYANTMTFAYVPILREVKVLLTYKVNGCSLIFDELTRSALQLQALSLMITTEVLPVPIARSFRCQLKQLDLMITVPIGFDILTITYFLCASTFLQKLNIKLWHRDFKKQSPAREYPDIQHFELKEVIIEGRNRMVVDLALYLVKHAVNLQKITIKGGCSISNRTLFLLLQDKIRPTVQLIFSTR